MIDKPLKYAYDRIEEMINKYKPMGVVIEFFVIASILLCFVVMMVIFFSIVRYFMGSIVSMIIVSSIAIFAAGQMYLVKRREKHDKKERVP